MTEIKRIFVEKRSGFDVQARELLVDLKDNLGISGLKAVRVLNRYDLADVTDEEFPGIVSGILAEPPVDTVFYESLETKENETVFGIEYLPGQYDQRADSAAQCIQLVTKKKRPQVVTARIIILSGEITGADLDNVKKYLINPVDSREASLKKPADLNIEFLRPEDVPLILDFRKKSDAELRQLIQSLDLAMGEDDLKFCQKYFAEEEKRDPTLAEIKVLDTYWSDHCRHTTFWTRIEAVAFEDGALAQPVRDAYRKFLTAEGKLRQKKGKEAQVSPPGDVDICLMDIATMSMKESLSEGMLDDVEISGEVNACSMIRPVEVEGRSEDWLILFKNETHNHPTEIEPFGGAATCLGGAIRDPLSGRAYVYQAMRVTGSGDPRRDFSQTLPGKLPQKKITTEAALGYSSYGNQIGVATGMVHEIYHEGYVSKRMEVGAVVGAVPFAQVRREEPDPGDIILLVGGKTGRDGIGGATGSSKKHTESSILTAGAEVQKGNAPEERKLQRLFRIPDVCRMIKKCNDFGAGGVSVAVGELAPGVDIDLDKVPKKYEGLNGTELALSESQERMAVVIAPESLEMFKRFAHGENLEATEIATASDSKRMRMRWRGQSIVDIARSFIETNGVRRDTAVTVTAPAEAENYFKTDADKRTGTGRDIKKVWLANLGDLNICSQMGLVERFDGTVGAGSVLLPFGGRYQQTPTEAMVAKIPVRNRETRTATVMSFGYNPNMAMWSPFHAGLFAVIEACAKVVATGADFSKMRFSLQEYFEKLGTDPKRWGKPFSALLGAYQALTELGVAAIGGKDSMSGSFEDIHVPPTLIAFGITTIDTDSVISPEFKNPNRRVVLLKIKRNALECPDFEEIKRTYRQVTDLIQRKIVVAAHSVREGGVAAAASRMCFGNRIGFSFSEGNQETLFTPDYGSLVLEISGEDSLDELFPRIDHHLLGYTTAEAALTVNGTQLSLPELFSSWSEPLERIFPTTIPQEMAPPIQPAFTGKDQPKAKVKIAKPRVLITAFPGTNCEYDTEKAFLDAGGLVDTLVFRNLNPKDIGDSLRELKEKIDRAQIIAIPGGFSAGDEPDGSGKFIYAVFRNPEIQDAVEAFLRNRDGLMVGICNGFQALVKLGLVLFGENRSLETTSPTLTFNTVGRHVSRMVRTKVVSNASPWFHHLRIGDIHTIPVSHGEGRFVASEEMFEQLAANGQIATQYVDFQGDASADFAFNPNGSLHAVEGITSPDGRILGKMAHSERRGHQVSKNIPGEKDQGIFKSGIDYFL